MVDTFTHCCETIQSEITNYVVKGQCTAHQQESCLIINEEDIITRSRDLGEADPRECELCVSETSAITLEYIDGTCYSVDNMSCFLDVEDLTTPNVYNSTEVLKEINLIGCCVTVKSTREFKLEADGRCVEVQKLTCELVDGASPENDDVAIEEGVVG